MMNNPGHIQEEDELLAKYLSGEATPEEAMAVDNWVKASSENRALFVQAMAVWEQTAAGNTWQLPDKLKLLAAIRRDRKPTKTATVKTLRWSIAAAILLLLGAAGAYWWLQPAHVTVPDSFVIRQADKQMVKDTLPDQSVVEIAAGASIKYKKDFQGNSRSIHLTGSAAFDVTSDPVKPFIVSVGDIQVKVLGTIFHVAEDAAQIMVVVKSGAVSMYRGDSGITLRAGDTGTYNNASHHFGLTVTDSTHQQTRSFNFTNTTLKEIATQMEKAYGIKVIFKNKKLETCTMSSSFDNKSIEFIFEVISITLNVQYRIEKDTVYISGIGCN